jgi:hypothetical protein
MDKITKEQQMKMIRKIRRDLELESGVYYKAAVHKSKKEKDTRKSKNIKDYEKE